MNALKSYKKRKVDEKAREILFEGMDGFIEHVDLLILYVLYAEFGFGAKRLRRFFWAIKEHYEAFRDTFIQPGDETRYYVDEMRMKKAIELLNHRSLTMDQIAEAVGYKNQFYFTKRFKKYYGVPPSKYKQKISVDLG